MAETPAVLGVIPYVFCADAGATADWCVEVLGFVERERWPDDAGIVRNVELVVGHSEVWLDGPVPDWRERTGGLGSWVGFDPEGHNWGFVQRLPGVAQSTLFALERYAL